MQMKTVHSIYSSHSHVLLGCQHNLHSTDTSIVWIKIHTKLNQNQMRFAVPMKNFFINIVWKKAKSNLIKIITCDEILFLSVFYFSQNGTRFNPSQILAVGVNSYKPGVAFVGHRQTV